MFIKRYLRLFLITSVLTVLVFLGGVWSGVELRKQLDRPFSIASHIHWRAVGFYNSLFRAGKSEQTRIVTNRVRLQVDTFFLPLDIAGKAGGITVVDGSNFGWPAGTYGTHYNTLPAVNRDRHEGHAGYDLPAAAFVPSIAPGTALAVINFNYAEEGDILVGGFNGNLYRVHNGERDGIVIKEIPMGDLRLRDMDRLDDGRIVIWTDDRRIITLTNDTRQTQADILLSRIWTLDDANLKASLEGMSETCLRCHSLEEGEMLAGPSLHQIRTKTPRQYIF